MKQCVPFLCNLFLKCASPSRISRWDPGQGILHSMFQLQQPKPFKHTLQLISQQYFPLKKFEVLYPCVPCFFFVESQQRQHHLLCCFFLLVFAWPVFVRGLGQGSSFLLCVKLRAPGHGREGKSDTFIVLHFCLIYTNLTFTYLFVHS